MKEPLPCPFCFSGVSVDGREIGIFSDDGKSIKEREHMYMLRCVNCRQTLGDFTPSLKKAVDYWNDGVILYRTKETK